MDMDFIDVCHMMTESLWEAIIRNKEHKSKKWVRAGILLLF